LRIDILSVVPDLLHSPLQHSIMQRAQTKGHLEVHVHNIRDYTTERYQQVDDYQFGGGAGMVLMCEPIANCIDALKAQRTYDEVIYTTPDGATLTQVTCNRMSMLNNLIILCGHYKGIDDRLRQTYITSEISIGDYVLSGGELAALVITDALGRLIPGVLNDETSALTDSFQDNLLAPPVYTRPAEWRGIRIPDILLSGHEAKINDWRMEQSLRRTEERRPDLLS
jgi:tRNA (guanine37-N1)-methyltransferase